MGYLLNWRIRQSRDLPTTWPSQDRRKSQKSINGLCEKLADTSSDINGKMVALNGISESYLVITFYKTLKTLKKKKHIYMILRFYGKIYFYFFFSTPQSRNTFSGPRVSIF